MRVTKRTWWSVFIVLLTLLQLAAAGVARFGKGEAGQVLDAEQARGVELARQVAASHERSDGTADTPANTQPEPVAGPRWKLLDGPDVATTLETVNSLGVEARVTFDVIKASTSNTVGKQTFQVAGHGAPAQVCEFLAAIENLERLVVVESGRVMPGDDEAISFEFALATYHTGGLR